MTSLNARIILAVSPLKQQPCNHNDDGSANLYYLKKIMFRNQQYVSRIAQKRSLDQCKSPPHLPPLPFPISGSQSSSSWVSLSVFSQYSLAADSAQQ
jgi:hypothetical protein